MHYEDDNSPYWYPHHVGNRFPSGRDGSRQHHRRLVRQIDIPQNELTILMEINIADSENCTVKCTWSGGFPTEEESGKAKYRFDGKQLTVTFLNEEERIATDHIFGLENVYDVSLAPDSLVILKNRQFRGVDVNFGRGYQNRGFAKIIFGD